MMNKIRINSILRNIIPHEYREKSDSQDCVCAEEEWCCDELRDGCTKRNFRLRSEPYPDSQFSATCCITGFYISVKKLNTYELVSSMINVIKSCHQVE